jgi:hypothetical protein
VRRILPATLLVAALATLLVANLATLARSAPTSSAHLYVRGQKHLATIVVHVGRSLDARTGEEPALLVVLVDPAPRPARATRGIPPHLAWLQRRLPEGSRIVVTAVGQTPPPLDPPQDLAGACTAIAKKPVGGARNLLGAVRRVCRTYRGWPGLREVLLVTDPGAEGEEETEDTLRVLRKTGFRFHVVAGEAAFSRPWTWSPARPTGFLVRKTGHPGGMRDTVYAGCETAFPDTPGAFDLGNWMAPVSYRLTPEHKGYRWYVLPSGFGYYHLARLAAATGGRYFVHGYGAKGGLNLAYDYGLLRLFEPDLRDRATILSEVSRHPLARALYRVWGRLADPGVGALRRRSPVLTGGPRLIAGEDEAVAPNRPLRLSFLGRGDAMGMADVAFRRLSEIERSLGDLESALRAHRSETGGRARSGDHRWLAQTQFLRLQLLRVRFHAGEYRASLLDIRDEDFNNQSVFLRPRTLYRGSVPVKDIELPAEARQVVRLDAVVSEIERFEETYAGTPWGVSARCGELFTFVIGTRDKGGSRPVVRTRSRGAKDETPAAKRRPAPTPRPSSGGGGTTTGD